MKIFLGTVEIASYYHSLKKILLREGYQVTFQVSITDKSSGLSFGYINEDKNFLCSVVQYLAFQISNGRRARLSLIRLFYCVLYRLVKFVWFIDVLIRHDVFIMSGFGSFFPHTLFDWRIIKFFKKKLIVIFHGSDCRPSYISGSRLKFIIHDGVYDRNDMGIIFDLALKNYAVIRAAEKYSDCIINFPLQAQFQKVRFVNGFFVGLPNKPDDVLLGQGRVLSTNGIRILHSPSNPFCKGTAEVRKVIANLKRRKIEIEYIELIEKPRIDVLHELSQCDIVIDQLYSDTYLAGFGCEAAWFGKPVITCGNGKESLRKIYGEECSGYFIYDAPEKLEEILIELITNKTYRKLCGKKLKEFVTKHWSSESIGKKFDAILKGNVPDEWYTDPLTIGYVYGSGISKDKLQGILPNYIRCFGENALFMQHNKELKKKILSFAGMSGECT